MDNLCLTPHAVDLFAGAGGLTLGLKRAGFTVIGAVEIEPVAVETYKANHPEVENIWNDIRKVSGADMLSTLNLQKGELDLLAGCPPCQGFSSIRTRNLVSAAHDDRNDLVYEYLRLVRELEPRAVMMENVPGMVKDKRLRDLIEGLSELGYAMNEDLTKIVQVRNAADFGVPQRRRRLILMTTKKGLVEFPRADKNHLTVRSAIANLPKVGQSGDELHDVIENRSERIKGLIKSVPKDGGSRADLDSEYQLKCHRDFNGFSDVYGRMAWEKVAPTITGGFFNPSKGRFLHPEEDRAITPREAAILQGFPQNYYFSNERGKSFCAMMIGNALPPEFVSRHARQIVKCLGLG